MYAVIDFFNVLKTSGMLENFCQLNGISISQIQNVIDEFKDMEKLIDEHNEECKNNRSW